MAKKIRKLDILGARNAALSFLALCFCGIIILEMFAVESLAVEPYHYDVRTDLSVYFTNSDEVIAVIRKCLKRHDWHIVVEFDSHSNNMDDISDIIGELMDYAVDETGNPDEGDYMRYQYGGYRLNYNDIKNKDVYHYRVEIIPHYYTTPEQEAEVSDKISEILDSFHFNRNTSDYEKFSVIYNYIYQNIKYDTVHKNNEYNHLKTTAYSALFYKTAVCQGYAVLLYRMLNESGIETRVITGKAVYNDKEEYHAWNIVKLGDKFYNLDITWNIQSQSASYYLRSDDDFGEHKRDDRFNTREFYEKYPMSAESFET